MEKIVGYDLVSDSSWTISHLGVDEIVSVMAAAPAPNFIVMLVPDKDSEQDPIQFNRYMDSWFRTPEEWIEQRGVNFYRKMMGLPELPKDDGCGDHILVKARRALTNTIVEICVECGYTSDGSLGENVFVKYEEFREQMNRRGNHCDHQWSRQVVGARCNLCGRRRAQ